MCLTSPVLLLPLLSSLADGAALAASGVGQLRLGRSLTTAAGRAAVQLALVPRSARLPPSDLKSSLRWWRGGCVTGSGGRDRVEGRGSEASTVTVMTFRIVGFEGGQPAEVEIRGRTLAGTVHDGDWVELLDQRAGSGRYEVARFTNLTTGSQVASYGQKSKAGALILVLLLVLVLVVIFIIIVVGLVGSS